MQGNGLFQILLPGIQCLSRKSIHQVDADVLETGFPTSFEGFDGLLGGMPAMKQLQGLFLKGLNAHADAVDGQTAKHGNILRCQVIGVGFEGNFCIVLYLIYMI